MKRGRKKKKERQDEGECQCCNHQVPHVHVPVPWCFFAMMHHDDGWGTKHMMCCIPTRYQYQLGHSLHGTWYQIQCGHHKEPTWYQVPTRCIGLPKAAQPIVDMMLACTRFFAGTVPGSGSSFVCRYVLGTVLPLD